MPPFDLKLSSEQIEAVMSLPVMARRQTAIRISGACPFRFHGEYANPPEGLIEWSIGAPGRNGTVFHNWTATYGEECLRQGVQTDLSAGREIARNMMKDAPGGMVQDFLSMVERYLEANPMVEPGSRFEQPVMVTPDGSPCVLPEDSIVHGTIDRLRLDDERILHIRDEKTDRYTPPRGELYRHFQVRTYAVGALIAYLSHNQRVKGIESRLAYVRSGIDRDLSFTPGELLHWWHTEFKARIESVAACVIDDNWPATPTGGYDGCNGCPFLCSCPFREQLALGMEAEIRDGHERELAEQYVYAAAFASHAKRNLQEHVAITGPVELTAGKVLGYSKRDRRVLDLPSEVVEALVAAGVDREEIWKRLSLSVGAAYELIEMIDPANRGPVLAEMEIQTVVETQEVFGVHEAPKPTAAQKSRGENDATETTDA